MGNSYAKDKRTGRDSGLALAQPADDGGFARGIPPLAGIVAVVRRTWDKWPYPRQSRHRAAVSRWKKTLPSDVSGAPPE